MSDEPKIVTDHLTGIGMRLVDSLDPASGMTDDQVNACCEAVAAHFLKEGDIFTIPAVYAVNPVITPEERQAAIDAATAAGLSLSDYLRERGLT